MHDASVKLLSFVHTSLFRFTRGVIGSRLVNNDMLLLTTTGRSSGDKHTVPLLYLSDEADVIVIASYGGRPYDPEWYRNLLADPDATIQIGTTHTAVTAETMATEQRQAWWPRIVEAYGDYDVYQSRTDREIPVIRLRTSE